ncbi:B3 domain-containing protein Os11g0197600-like isoform X2 [Phragmites australis]|uniref:B3 domain-containing protein Os11g0197600-like isoform X2 n=1 Tax=Phragmites australis TaxID=29695 RepID=UPI002D79A00D|nr:B3 domain-containing protein Os11g0197600-like isoform X2 [Phragmites australis]
MGRKKQQGSSSAAVAARESGKEKQKQKDGKEGKQKQKDGKEGEAIGAGQRFFKVFFPEQSGERLKIPSPFHQYLEDKPSGLVSLKSPSGGTWQVVLTSDSEGLWFAGGWNEFVRDHSLKKGHFLVFTYDGHSQFCVVVFCPSGVEDPSALVAQPCKDRVVNVENGEGDIVIDAGGTSEISTFPLEEGNGTTRKRNRGTDDLIADGSASKWKKAEKKRPDGIVGTSKAASTILNSNKVIFKKARQPVVISQRRPVTEEEKNLALKRAKEFKSKNPFAMQIMMDSYVYVGFFMNISCEFVRESLPKTSKKMTLWDPQGKPWEVNYVYYSDRCVASFSGGWGKFSLGNNLEKFDVCVFELFKEDNIKVHIYRVVPEITPLLRSIHK